MASALLTLLLALSRVLLWPDSAVSLRLLGVIGLVCLVSILMSFIQ
jgi:hypothetical protein